MELFALYFIIILHWLLFWILNYIDIVKKNLKIESFPPLGDLVLDNIYIHLFFFSSIPLKQTISN